MLPSRGSLCTGGMALEEVWKSSRDQWRQSAAHRKEKCNTAAHENQKGKKVVSKMHAVMFFLFICFLSFWKKGVNKLYPNRKTAEWRKTSQVRARADKVLCFVFAVPLMWQQCNLGYWSGFLALLSGSVCLWKRKWNLTITLFITPVPTPPQKKHWGVPRPSGNCWGIRE